MHSLKLMTAAMLGMVATATLAHAQGYVTDGLGTGRDPVSLRASNITPDDAKSVAPALPTPAVGADASPRAYLHAARDALVAGRTGEAQQSLEMAETRVLSRVVPAGTGSMPDGNPAVSQIQDALQALGNGDRARALDLIDAMAR